MGKVIGGGGRPSALLSKIPSFPSLGKRAVFFSIITVFMIILFEISSNISTETDSQDSKLSTTRVRVEYLNSIVKDFEERYFARMLYISAKNAFRGLSEYYSVDPSALQYHVKDVISQVILEGNLTLADGSEIDLKTAPDPLQPYVNSSYTLNALILNVTDLFRSLNIRVTSFKMNVTYLNQTDPWHVAVGGKASYYLADADGIASWKGNVYVEVNVSIIGFYTYPYTPNQGEPMPPMEKITASWVRDSIDDTSGKDLFDGLGSFWCYDLTYAGSTYSCFREPSFINKMSPPAIEGYRPFYNSTKDDFCRGCASGEHGLGLCLPVSLGYSALAHDCSSDNYLDYP